MNSIETHLPVLKKLFQITEINTVLEFGTGIHSTPFFIEKCKKVTSIEMQSKSWFDKVSNQFKDPKFRPILKLGPYAYKELHLESFYDLIFVDGHGESRWDVTNNSFEKTNIIVIHDTQEKSYNWNKINKPENWIRKDIKDFSVWTTVLTNNREIIEKL